MISLTRLDHTLSVKVTSQILKLILAHIKWKSTGPRTWACGTPWLLLYLWNKNHAPFMRCFLHHVFPSPILFSTDNASAAAQSEKWKQKASLLILESLNVNSSLVTSVFSPSGSARCHPWEHPSAQLFTRPREVTHSSKTRPLVSPFKLSTIISHPAGHFYLEFSQKH